MQQLSKLISIKQTRAADQHTISDEPISSIDLMERASRAFVYEFIHHFPWLYGQRVCVLCGQGNNGGDGLAVARLLREREVAVDVWCLELGGSLSGDNQKNRSRVGSFDILKTAEDLMRLQGADIYVDAIFGSGLTRPPEGLAAIVVDYLNNQSEKVVSIDVPSGLYGEGLTPEGPIVHADLVISFQRPKQAFFLPENNSYIHRWVSVDIGLDEKFIQSLDSDSFVLDERVRSLVKSRKRFSHKGTYGHALLIAGAYGTMGAAALSARACTRSGVGLLTCYVPEAGYEIMQIHNMEAMCQVDGEREFLSEAPELGDKYSAIGIGPGIGQQEDTAEMLEATLRAASVPCVLDADALNILAKSPELFEFLPDGSVLTPHVKEFDRLAGTSEGSSLDRFERATALAKEHNCVIVLKDAHTVIFSPGGRRYYNTTGNPGMATGGSGDVLTGIILGLLAQPYSSLEAACIGVYFHGLAGDHAAEKIGHAALTARDLVEGLRIEGEEME